MARLHVLLESRRLAKELRAGTSGCVELLVVLPAIPGVCVLGLQFSRLMRVFKPLLALVALRGLQLGRQRDMVLCVVIHLLGRVDQVDQVFFVSVLLAQGLFVARV